MKYELITASAAILLKFEFTHWKMVFQQIFFAAQRDMDEMPQMVQRSNFSRGFRKMWSSNRLTHAETALTTKMSELFGIG